MNTTIAQQIANEGGVEAYLHAQQHKSLLRFLTCGSVDDGKSTLIGRLLHDRRHHHKNKQPEYHDNTRKSQRRRTDTALGFRPQRSRDTSPHRLAFFATQPPAHETTQPR